MEFQKEKQRHYYTYKDFFTFTAQERGLVSDIAIESRVSNTDKNDVRKKKPSGKWNDYNTRPKKVVSYLGINRILPPAESQPHKSYRNNFNRNILTAEQTDEIRQYMSKIFSCDYSSISLSEHNKYRLFSAKKNVEYTPSVTIDLATEDVGGQTIIDKGANRPVFELRLLGMYSDEAIRALEHQIDLCVLHNFQHFSVIHGKGDGILQQAVRDYLSHCPAVDSFEFAPAEDGGAGKTYVTIK